MKLIPSKISVNVSMNIVKCLAIISVIMAHARSVNDPFISIITERIGALGVVAFLIVAGYYFNIEKYGFANFFKNKIKTIIIPWIFIGTLIYLVGLKFDLKDWFLWIIGYKTYLYYLSVIMMCYFLVGIFRKKIYLQVFIILNIISLVLTGFGYLDWLASKIAGAPFVLYNYLNVFNWIGFFSLGVLLKSKMEIVLSFVNTYKLLIVLGYILVLVLSVYIEPNAGGYFSKLAIPLELMGVLCMFSLATIKFFDYLPISKIAELSFGVYLIHFITFPVKKFLVFSPFMDFINPFIILGLSCSLLLIGLKFAEIFRCQKIYCILLGIRESKKQVANDQ